MSGKADTGAFLDLVYDAALDPGLWVKVLEQFGDMLGADAINLSQLHLQTGAGSAVTARVDPAVLGPYFSYYAQRNPLLAVDSVPEYMAGWAPRVLTDEDWMPRAEFVRSEYYNDFMKPIGSDWLLMIRLALQGAELASVAVGRRLGKGRYGEDELALANRLQPHLIRAYGLGRKVAASGRLSEGLAQALDASVHAMLVLGADRRPRHVNRAGERLLQAGRGLGLVGGRLVATGARAEGALAGLIARAASPDGRERAGGSLALEAAPGRLPLGVTVAPVRPDPLALWTDGPAVLVCVSDPEALASPSAQRLASLFGLTAAESRLALALAEGLTLQEAAARFGISVNTVRVQLAAVFAKTGTHRQPELMRVLLGAAESG